MENAPKHIVVVDDDPHMLELYRDLLRDFGTVTTYTDPFAAQDSLVEHNGSCDLLITDFDMPGLNGVELSRMVRNNKPVPVIFVSGYPLDIEAAGHIKVFQKPFKMNEFLSFIEASINHSTPINL